MYVKLNGEMRYLRRAVDHEGEVLDSFGLALEIEDLVASSILAPLMRRSRAPSL